MGQKLNLPVSASLNTTNFNKGIRSMQASVKGLQTSLLTFGASFGAALGVGGILKSMKDVAVDLNVARATLENVSSSAEEYASNLKFVKNLSKSYNQDLITLTDNFAKFKASMVGTNITLDQQKEIYDGLTRAATFYHMSASRTEQMFNAINQMASKGKVMSEELRRQLGNNLPGAFQKMAQAAIDTSYKGIKSLADFEKAMKDGKVGVDLLVQFVRNLNKETSNINLDSLQLQANKLKNTFTEFVESSNFEEFVVSLYKDVEKLLLFAEKHLQAIKNIIIGIIGAVSLKWIITGIQGIVSWIKTAVAWLKKIGPIFSGIGSNIATLGKLVKGLRIASIATPWIAAFTAMSIGISKITGEVKKYKKEVKETADALAEMASVDWGKTDAQSRADRSKEIAESTDKWLRENHDNYQANLRRLEYLNGPEWSAPAFSTNSAQMRMAEVNKLEREIKLYQDKEKLYAQAMLDWKAAEKELLTQASTVTNGVTGGEGEGDENDLVKALKKFRKEYGETSRQLKEGSITASEAYDSIKKLVEKTWQSVTAFENFRSVLPTLDADLQQAAKDVESAFNTIDFNDSVRGIYGELLNFRTEAEKLQNKLADGRITEKEYEDELEKLSLTTYDNLKAFKNLDAILDILGTDAVEAANGIEQIWRQARQQRTEAAQAEFHKETAAALAAPDTTNRFAYKESKADYYDRLADAYKSQLDKVQKLITDAVENQREHLVEDLTALQAAEAELIKNVTNMQDLRDLAEWAEDIKELKADLRKAGYEGFKDIAEGVDRFTRGWKNLKETLEDVDTTPWEKFLALLNETIQAMDTLKALTETFNTITELTAQIRNAQNARELNQLAAQNALQSQGNILAQQRIGITAQQTAANITQASTSQVATSANASEAIAGATASGAKIPYPWNLVAIGTGVAAVIAALSNINKFASGGIVGGNSLHGDKIIAGLNSGELVLNKGQQGKLWNLINGGGSGTGGSQEIKFKVEGKDLTAVLKNYQTIRKG